MIESVKFLWQPRHTPLVARSYIAISFATIYYVVLFLFAYPHIGTMAVNCAYGFIGIIAWFYGIRRALVAVLFCSVFTAFILGPAPHPQSIIGIALFFIDALAIGGVSRLYVKLKDTEVQLREEHEKSELILSNIFPRKIVERLKNGEVLIADKYLETTILFSDLVGFTELTKTMKPHDLVVLLNKVITGFDQLSERFHIEKIKTIGDAYLVVSGLPDENSNHAPDICRMALEMQHFIEDFNRTENLRLQIRIGIHSGSVIGGVIGPKKFTFDLWGDTVNLASRLETTGVPGKIHVSAATRELVKDLFQFEIREPLEIKGHGTMQTYFICS